MVKTDLFRRKLSFTSKKCFFEFQNMKRGMFLSGPFTNMIFSVIEKQRNKLKVLIGKATMTITKNSNYLFRPV